MPVTSGATTKRETLNIRIKPEERSLIDLAARMRGKNRTDFILEAVQSAVEEALFEQACQSAWKIDPPSASKIDPP